MKRSAKPSTAGPNRLPDRSVEKGGQSSLFHLHHREPEVVLDIERPMAWAVALVARRARSVMLLRSLREAESRLASSLASILA